jgi:hypothetical protein
MGSGVEGCEKEGEREKVKKKRDNTKKPSGLNNSQKE